MTIVDRLTVRRFHEIRVDQHGEGTTQALGWKNFHSQQARFAMLEDIGDMNDCSVLDIGCGHGDLRAYLDDKYPRLRYAGIDQMESFLDIAIDRYAHLPNTVFYHGDCYSAELPGMDYVLACGSLSYRNSDEDFIEQMISKLFNTCRIALGFNLLSRVDEPGGILMAYSPEVIVKYCRTLTDNVILHEGYFDDDFTIWMYK
jgi:trans-aconitate methyltransferase